MSCSLIICSLNLTAMSAASNSTRGIERCLIDGICAALTVSSSLSQFCPFLVQKHFKLLITLNGALNQIGSHNEETSYRNLLGIFWTPKISQATSLPLGIRPCKFIGFPLSGQLVLREIWKLFQSIHVEDQVLEVAGRLCIFLGFSTRRWKHVLCCQICSGLALKDVANFIC